MKVVTYDTRGATTSATEMPDGDFFLKSMKSTVEGMGWAGFIECSDEQFLKPASYWVDLSSPEPALKAKKALPIKLSGLKLYGVPDKAVITIEGQKYTADGTPIELSFSHPGTFQVQVEAFPYLDASVEVVYETGA